MMGVTALVNNFNVEAYLSLGWEIRAEMVDEWGRPAMLMEWRRDEQPEKPEHEILPLRPDDQCSEFQFCGI